MHPHLPPPPPPTLLTDKNDLLLWSQLKDAGLPPKMYQCVHDNLVLNNVGVDCIHYLFDDYECRAFIAFEYPDDVLYAYDRLIPTAFKADLWRYCVLYKYGGAYMDIKLGFIGGGGGGGGGGGVSLRTIVERWLGSGGGVRNGGGLFVLERDEVGLWPTGRFGLHNAFIITKPKNPILLECIYRIVSASKIGVGGGEVTDAYDVGWMTRPLFITGPGLLGDVWRWWRSGVDGAAVADSYATMVHYFRLFFEGDGCIGYFVDGDGDGDGDRDGDGEYIKLLKVYEDYQEEYHHMMTHTNCVPHYTLLWSNGLVWRGGPPGVPPPNGGATLDRPKGASPGVPPPNGGATLDRPTGGSAGGTAPQRRSYAR
jgi:hypothetical protein